MSDRPFDDDETVFADGEDGDAPYYLEQVASHDGLTVMLVMNSEKRLSMHEYAKILAEYAMFLEACNVEGAVVKGQTIN